MITRNDLQIEVKYFGAKMGEDFALIGYVDVKDGEKLVFHAGLTQRTVSEVEGKTAEEIQTMAQAEANIILAGECAEKCINDYLTLANLGLY